MSQIIEVEFDQEHLLQTLDALDDVDLDRLEFGVIGFDASTLVTRYNAFESVMAGLRRERILGVNLFTVVAPCMNNFMVAQRFIDARDQQATLDVAIDYVLTLRMRPVRVVLRLLAAPDRATRWILVDRRA